MSIVYCSRLEASAWQEVTQFAEALRVPAVHEDVSAAEIVGFDGGPEYSGGIYAFGANATETQSDRGRAV